MGRRLLSFMLMALGSLLLTFAFWFPAWSSWAGRRLIASAPRRAVRVMNLRAGPTTAWTAAPPAVPPKIGQVVGVLQIPALDLTTAVVQGTTGSVLFRAPGHYVASVLPGEQGVSVIAAHNASFFRHLDRLVPGQLIIVATAEGRFWFRVTGHRIVRAGTAVPTSDEPTLVLEACYPLDALFFTPDRYLVTAVLASDRLGGAQDPLSPATSPSYTAPIPPYLSQHFALSLQYNSIPMGRLTYEAPSTPRVTAFEQGAAPLALETEAIRVFNAVRDASEIRNAALLGAMGRGSGPVTTSSDKYWGASGVTYPGVLNVRVTLTAAGVPSAVVLSDADVLIDGVPASVTLTLRVAGRTESVQSLAFSGPG